VYSVWSWNVGRFWYCTCSVAVWWYLIALNRSHLLATVATPWPSDACVGNFRLWGFVWKRCWWILGNLLFFVKCHRGQLTYGPWVCHCLYIVNMVTCFVIVSCLHKCFDHHNLYYMFVHCCLHYSDIFRRNIRGFLAVLMTRQFESGTGSLAVVLGEHSSWWFDD